MDPPLRVVIEKSKFFYTGLLQVATITKHNSSKKPFLRLSIITRQLPADKRMILDVIPQGFPCSAGTLP